MIVILRDFPIENYKDTLAESLREMNVLRVGSVRTSHRIVGWIKGCAEAIRKTSSRDIIVAMFDYQAVICWWLCKVTCKRRNIVCVNLMLKDKIDIKNRLIKLLYKKPLSSMNFVASVDSIEYGEWIKQRFKLGHELHLVHDVCRREFILDSNILYDTNSYIFAGGSAERDWRFAFNLASMLPTKEFRFVMSRRDFEKYKDIKPDNVLLYHNIPSDKFLTMLARASLVLLPINVQSPAGLIVLFQAGANKIPVIISSTLASREYVTNNRGTILQNDLKLWKDNIEYILNNADIYLRKAEDFYDFLFLECSDECYNREIRKMIEIFQ